MKAHILSDGTLRFICLATLLLQSFELMPDTIIIDEPELGLHPAALSLLSELIKRVSDKKQLILSSQSVELINNFEPENIIVVDRKNNESMFICSTSYYRQSAYQVRNILLGWGFTVPLTESRTTFKV